MRLFRPIRDDRGSSMAAVLMVTMVVSVVGITSIQLAQHSNDSTSVDRERLQTVQAAEAGVHDAIRRIEAGAGCDVAASAYNDLHDNGGLVGRFRTRIDPEAGTVCNETPRRVIHAWGYAPTGGNRALRHIEVTVELIPHDGFAFTLFAQGGDGSIYMKNTGTITGDAYAELVDQSKNNLNGHNIITTGSLTTQNDAIYSGSLWVGGDVTLGENAVVAESITAAGSSPGTQGNVVMNNNVQVGGDVLANGTVSQGLGVVVNGAISQNNPNLPPPPALTKPTFTYDPANYTPAPTTGTAAQITTALFTNRNNLQGTYYASDSGTVALPNNGRVTGPLTIISEGNVDMGRNLNVPGGSGPFQVAIIALGTAADAIDFGATFNSAPGLHVLLFTNGGVDGRNLMNFTGSIYGDMIDAKNAFTINESEWLRTHPPAGFTWDLSSASEFTAVPTLWREIVPGAPPD